MKRTQRTTLLVLAALAGLPPAAQAAPEPEKAARSSALAPQTIAAGDWHTCGLRGDGTVACWGENAYGESTSSGGTFCEVYGRFTEGFALPDLHDAAALIDRTQYRQASVGVLYSVTVSWALLV